MPSARPAQSDPFARARDPFALFARWMAQARAAEPHDPDAAALATTGNRGLPNLRMVLVRQAGPEGFVFFTNLESVKGRELHAHPAAALCFHWKSARRQVRVRGKIRPCTQAQADAYFASRSRANQIGAWASQQSRPLASPAALQRAAAAIEKKFRAQPIPRPPYWGGFRLIPREIEFWQSAPARLHHRILFRLPARAGSVQILRLFP